MDVSTVKRDTIQCRSPKDLTLVCHEVCKVPNEFSNEKLATVFVKRSKVIGMEWKLIIFSEGHWRVLGKRRHSIKLVYCR